MCACIKHLSEKKRGISKMQINYLLFNANETESSIKYRLFFIGYRFVNSTLLALFMEERKWSFVIPCYTALNTKWIIATIVNCIEVSRYKNHYFLNIKRRFVSRIISCLTRSTNRTQLCNQLDNLLLDYQVI